MPGRQYGRDRGRVGRDAHHAGSAGLKWLPTVRRHVAGTSRPVGSGVHPSNRERMVVGSRWLTKARRTAHADTDIHADDRVGRRRSPIWRDAARSARCRDTMRQCTGDDGSSLPWCDGGLAVAADLFPRKRTRARRPRVRGHARRRSGFGFPRLVPVSPDQVPSLLGRLQRGAMVRCSKSPVSRGSSPRRSLAAHADGRSDRSAPCEIGSTSTSPSPWGRRTRVRRRDLQEARGPPPPCSDELRAILGSTDECPSSAASWRSTPWPAPSACWTGRKTSRASGPHSVGYRTVPASAFRITRVIHDELRRLAAAATPPSPRPTHCPSTSSAARSSIHDRYDIRYASGDNSRAALYTRSQREAATAAAEAWCARIARWPLGLRHRRARRWRPGS